MLFALARVLVNALIIVWFVVSLTCPEMAVCVSGNAAAVYSKNKYLALVGCIPPKAGARNRTNDGASSHAGPATQRILRPSATRSGRALPKRAQPMSACDCRTALPIAILRHASCLPSKSNFFLSVFKYGTAG